MSVGARHSQRGYRNEKPDFGGDICCDGEFVSECLAPTAAGARVYQKTRVWGVLRTPQTPQGTGRSDSGQGAYGRELLATRKPSLSSLRPEPFL